MPVTTKFKWQKGDAWMKTIFTDGWKFCETEFGTTYEEALARKDDFCEVEIPHDYMINDPHNLYRDSTGWYFKDFECSDEDLQKELFLIFDGIYMDSIVYLNGQVAGE